MANLESLVFIKPYGFAGWMVLRQWLLLMLLLFIESCSVTSDYIKFKHYFSTFSQLSCRVLAVCALCIHTQTHFVLFGCSFVPIFYYGFLNSFCVKCFFFSLSLSLLCNICAAYIQTRTELVVFFLFSFLIVL